MKKSRPNRMLVILAHPDDESYTLGGTLAKFSHQGVQVVLLTSTDGEISIPGEKPEIARAIREQELLQAGEYLGIEVYFHSFDEGEISKVDPKKLLENIVCWIDTVQPQVILTFGPEGVSGHPDHNAICHAVTLAVEQYFPSVCLLYFVPTEETVLRDGVSFPALNLNTPLITVDISDYKIEKFRAILSHTSQSYTLEGKPEEAADKIPGYEYFMIAHAVNNSNNLVDCFNV